ncbi:MAG TPA: succinate dehydrogenase, cytochrome b556 subunit [Alphaproteobacteria bacterium]
MSSSPSDTATKAARSRPLSPHLQIFRFSIPMLTSILHRITGVALVGGSFVLLWWLVALAQSPEAYGTFVTIALHPLGQICLAGWTWAFFYQLLNGVRHLVYDTGTGFKLKTTYFTGRLVLVLSVIATAASWWCFYNH